MDLVPGFQELLQGLSPALTAPSFASLFTIIEPFLGDVVMLGLDDTLARKRGLRRFGTGMHHDPLSSTRSLAFVRWGHSWVVLGVTAGRTCSRSCRAIAIRRVGCFWRLGCTTPGPSVLRARTTGLASVGSGCPARRTCSKADAVACMLPGRIRVVLGGGAHALRAGIE